jgi:PAS domain S-box-containing protein
MASNNDQSEISIRYNTILESTNDAIFLMNDDTFIDCNEYTEKLFGLKNKTDIMGRSPIEFSPELQPDGINSADKAKMYINKAMEGKQQRFYWKHKKLDGSLFDADVSLNRYEYNNEYYILAIVRDISETRYAYENLKLREEDLRVTLNSLNEGVISTNLDGFIKRLNPSAENLIGKTSINVINTPVSEVLHVKDNYAKIDILEIIHKVKKNKKSIKLFDIDLINDKNEIIKNISLSISPILDYESQTIGIVITIYDLTEETVTKDLFKLSEHRLRSIISSFPIGMHFYDFNNDELIFMGANEMADKILGISHKELIGKEITAAFPDLKDTEIPQRYKEAALGKTWETELVTYKDDRIEGAYQVKAFQTEPHKMVALFENISSRVQMQKEISESRDKYQRLVENLDDFIFRYELVPEPKYSYVSPSVEKITGFSQEDYYNDPLISNKLIHPDDTENVEFDYTNEEEIRKPKIARFYNKDGSLRWKELRLVPIVNETNVVIAIEGITIDITEQKNMQIKIQESENKYRRLVENLRDVIYRVEHNPEWRLTYISPIIEKLIGIPPNDFIKDQKLIFKHIHPDDLHKLKRLIYNPSDEEASVELRWIDFNKAILWTELKRTPIYDNEGKLIASEGIISDISERKKYEEELIEAKEKAEESDKLKSAFLSNLSHEIRTPLNGIFGFMNLLKEPMLSESEKSDYISYMESSGDRLMNLIQDLLRIASIQANQVGLIVEDINIIDIVESCFNKYQKYFKEKSIHFSLNINMDNEDSLIKSDNDKIYSILLILLSNALKFTLKGRVDLGVERKNKYLQFYVKDTGVGIAKERQKAIFDKFVQADLRLSRPYEGAGLGLAIAKAYVEMLDGEIWLESKENLGSIFTFRIPFYRSSLDLEQEQQIKEAEENERSFKDIKVLIAEDDLVSEKYLEKLLNRHSFSIYKSRNGVEAIKMITENPDISMILMDLKMPILDGISATKKIREFNKSVIIIAQSAYALQLDKDKAIAAGCNDFITKPINSDELIEMLKKYS